MSTLPPDHPQVFNERAHPDTYICLYVYVYITSAFRIRYDIADRKTEREAERLFLRTTSETTLIKENIRGYGVVSRPAIRILDNVFFFIFPLRENIECMRAVRMSVRVNFEEREGMRRGR